MNHKYVNKHFFFLIKAEKIKLQKKMVQRTIGGIQSLNPMKQNERLKEPKQRLSQNKHNDSPAS